MTWLIYFFGSGAAFFAGVGLVLLATAILSLSKINWAKRSATLSAILGLIFVTLSATPLPYWFYGIAGVISLLWLIAERLEQKTIEKSRIWFRVTVVFLLSAAFLIEVPYRFAPALKVVGRPTLYIFADSVTAGMGDASTETWPHLLARAHSIKVRDYSQMGAKVSSMRRKAESTPVEDGIVLLEIGGNDLLGSTSAIDFERDLDQLLTKLSGKGRIMVMFELPLPPFANEFGRIQRRLAKKYGAYLVPKRIFVGVLTTDQATVDSLHLSQLGHVLMAETVWSLIRTAYDN